MTVAGAPTSLSADQALVEACLRDAPGARRLLVETYHGSVRQSIELLAVRWGARLGSGDVDDAVQQAFFALLARDLVILRAWRGDARLKTYLNRVAERVASRHFQTVHTAQSRFRSVFSTDEAGDGGPDAALESVALEAQRQGTLEAEPELSERLESAETRERLRAAILARLSEKGRDYYRYLFVEELDVGAICAREDTNANNVYQWKNRILREAAAVMEEEDTP